MKRKKNYRGDHNKSDLCGCMRKRKRERDGGGERERRGKWIEPWTEICHVWNKDAVQQQQRPQNYLLISNKFSIWPSKRQSTLIYPRYSVLCLIHYPNWIAIAMMLKETHELQSDWVDSLDTHTHSSDFPHFHMRYSFFLLPFFYQAASGCANLPLNV